MNIYYSGWLGVFQFYSRSSVLSEWSISLWFEKSFNSIVDHLYPPEKSILTTLVISFNSIVDHRETLTKKRPVPGHSRFQFYSRSSSITTSTTSGGLNFTFNSIVDHLVDILSVKVYSTPETFNSIVDHRLEPRLVSRSRILPPFNSIVDHRGDRGDDRDN